ncbi:hypothetical protein [Erinnyis ello granulovirus]|uniref:Uncharacterized protein n=1 Tax=Erinnyis ello granulovirus TaxID=307444 RepID=A0A097DAU3_9BBAC|nr:hypothetical protein [Erinnyis ello granulovirus]AIS92122.1 hypothetical protein [Erinnyis ello granulovirus]ARX71463.1 hypothetical protein EREL_124 [Erinnyis ello granulovirus]ARX71593.1 hypothetical protein EREL_124 [Erinnyis ello granulovirus]ARX71723.1 hypothetical protein EREL_124 [Erinnyis ello granulovirus]ARX71853.1 hypothetical protein EREL_124 [Erinnyis ello granulovirus]
MNTPQQQPLLFSPKSGIVLQENITPTPSTSEQQIIIDVGGGGGGLLVAIVPKLHNLTLDSLQTIVNTHLQEVYPQSYTAYQLTHMKGDRAVAYLYFVHYLIVNGVNKHPLVFKRLCEVMHKMYTQWSDQIKYLYPLVVNYNGADPTKEMMNIVNQCVYSVVKFVFNNVLGVRVNDYFADLQENFTLNTYQLSDVYFSLYADQQQLSALFNVAIGSLKSTQKFYNYEEATPTVNVSAQKLQIAPTSTLLEIPFKVISHPSEESEA